MSIEALLLTLLGSIRRPSAFCTGDCSTGGRAMSFQEKVVLITGSERDQKAREVIA
jgi:hypothetical protein